MMFPLTLIEPPSPSSTSSNQAKKSQLIQFSNFLLLSQEDIYSKFAVI